MPDYSVPRFSRDSITGYGGKINPWLLFYRFLNGESDDRYKRLDIFKNRADLSRLKHYIGRERAARESWRKRYGAETLLDMKLALTERMIVGMGIESDFENGLLLHWVHGFPYVNGEALKGAARAWAVENRAHEKDPTPFARIFGSLNKQETNHEALSRGEVIFFDAIPELHGNCFDIDIVTCHYSDYYTGEPPQKPGGWEQPNPVLFLTVSPGTAFEFSIAAYDPEMVEIAWGWLTSALIKRGLGAKKRAGYGHFAQPLNNSGATRTSEPSSPLENFLKRIESLNAGNIPGQAAELVRAIEGLPAKCHSEASHKLFERIPKKTLKKKAKKNWVVTLMRLKGE